MERNFGIPGSLTPLDMESRELVLGNPTIETEINLQTIPFVTREVLANTLQQYDEGAPRLYNDPFWNSLENGGDWNSGINGLRGLGAVKSPATPDTVSIQKAQPVRTSTVYLVVGLAALAVGSAVAFWWMSKSKKGATK